MSRTSDIIWSWWTAELSQRDKRPKARALASRLRRAGVIEALSEPAVHTLAQSLALGPGQAERLAQLVTLLAELREHEAAPLPRLMGGAEPVVSRARFERLMRAEGAELTAGLRRAIAMLPAPRCHVGRLGADVLSWNDNTRARWCFEYFGEIAPLSVQEATP